MQVMPADLYLLFIPALLRICWAATKADKTRRRTRSQRHHLERHGIAHTASEMCMDVLCCEHGALAAMKQYLSSLLGLLPCVQKFLGPTSAAVLPLLFVEARSTWKL